MRFVYDLDEEKKTVGWPVNWVSIFFFSAKTNSGTVKGHIKTLFRKTVWNWQNFKIESQPEYGTAEIDTNNGKWKYVAYNHKQFNPDSFVITATDEDTGKKLSVRRYFNQKGTL